MRWGRALINPILLIAGLIMAPLAWTQSQQELLAQVGEQLTHADIVAGDFEQAQHVAVLSRPLVSRGRFVFVRDRGIFWQVQQPLQSTLVLAADGGVASDEVVAGERALGFVARLLNSVLAGDLASLNNNFEVRGEVTDQGWTLQLTPRSGPLARVIRAIDLKGTATVDRVELVDAGGDRSELRFSQVGFPAQLPDYAASLQSGHGAAGAQAD